MSERRTLIEGLKATPQPISAAEKSFVYKSEEPSAPPPRAPAKKTRVPFSSRMREDLAKSIKKTSLERQLAGVEPYALQELLEAAVESWLRANGYTDV